MQSSGVLHAIGWLSHAHAHTQHTHMGFGIITIIHMSITILRLSCIVKVLYGHLRAHIILFSKKRKNSSVPLVLGTSKSEFYQQSSMIKNCANTYEQLKINDNKTYELRGIVGLKRLSIFL